ncbi:MAG: TonB-dependent receptor [Balneolaceae bacterium]|nr:MAG: TonB-dependent receptor [Balneolaceae bacterium]
MNPILSVINLTVRMLYSKVSLFLICLSVPSFLHAQSAETDSISVNLDEIRVEATHSSLTLGRAPLSVSFFRRSDVDMTIRTAETLNDLTHTLPGIWISNRENHALGERMTIRGMGWRSPFGVRGIMVVLDDIPLTVADGQSILNIVDPAMITSVELLRGPSATFWGNASGGVLYMRTRSLPDAPRLSYRAYTGSYNTVKQELRWSDIVQGVRMQAYASYLDSDGFRDHSAYRHLRGGISAGFDVSAATTVEARIAYAGMPKAQHPGSLNRNDALTTPSMAVPAFENLNAGKDFQQLMASLNVFNRRDSGVLNISGNLTYRELSNPLTFGYISVDRLAGGVRTTYDFSLLPVDLQIGSELKWQQDDRLQRNNIDGQPGDIVSIDQKDQVASQAIFAQTGVSKNRLSFNLGIRADRMSFSVNDFLGQESSERSFFSVNPSAGITYDTGSVLFYTSASSSFESPTTTEFKNRPGGGTGFNPDLNPEKTVGFDAGARGSIRFLDTRFDMAFFNLNVDGLIVPFQASDGGPTFYRNEGRTEHYGFESHVRTEISRHLNLNLMYTYTNATFSEGTFSGNRIPGVAPHRFGSALELHLGSNLFLTDAEWIGSYYADSANEALNKSYFIVNTRYLYQGFTSSNWSLQPFISIMNLFNARYNTSVAINAFGGRFYEPGSDRNFRVGVRLNII